MTKSNELSENKKLPFTMTFSDFAKMLHKRIGKRKIKSEFLIEMTNQIMKKPIEIANPLRKMKADTLNRIFDGSRALSKEVAEIIYNEGKIDKDGFEGYIVKFGNEAIDLLEKDLIDNNIPIKDTAFTTCADLFEEILEEYSNKTYTNLTKKMKSLSNDLDNHKENKVFKETNNLFLRVQDDDNIACQIRDLFKQGDEGYTIDDFIMPEVVSQCNGINIDDPLYDIYYFLQTIYDQYLTNEYPFDDAMKLFEMINIYLNNTVYDYTKFNPDEINKMRNDILDWLKDLYDL